MSKYIVYLKSSFKNLINEINEINQLIEINHDWYQYDIDFNVEINIVVPMSAITNNVTIITNVTNKTSFVVGILCL